MSSANSYLQLADGIYSRCIDLGDYNVRNAVVLGEHTALIFDTHACPDDLGNILPLIGNRKIVVVYSHGDWDHIWGTTALEGHYQTIYAHEKCFKRFSSDIPLRLQEYQQLHPERYDEVKLIPPDKSITAQTDIDLGGMTVELHPLPGHTQDSLVGFIPQRGVLLAADTVETPFPCVGDPREIDNWIGNLENWTKHPQLRKVIPAHGSIGGKEIILENIYYLKGIKSGKNIEIDQRLTDFYKTTHLENMALFNTKLPAQ